METRVQKIARENNIDSALAEKIIVHDHALKNLYSPDELTIMKLDVNDEVKQFVEKYQKLFKVSLDAIITMVLLQEIENKSETKPRKKQTKGSRKGKVRKRSKS